MFPFFIFANRRAGTTGPMLKDASYSHYRLYPQTATAKFFLYADGRAESSGSAAPVDAASYAWEPAGLGMNYEVNATVTSGSTPTGSATGTWLSLGTNRSWTVTETAPGSVTTSTMSVSLRYAPGGSVITTKSITLTATVDA